MSRLLALAEAEELSTDAKQFCRKRLVDCGAALRHSQQVDGAWDASWYTDNKIIPVENEHLARVISTSHALEWLWYAPRECTNGINVEMAVAYLLRAMIDVPQDKLQSEFPPYTHALNAVLLWTPEQIDEQ